MTWNGPPSGLTGLPSAVQERDRLAKAVAGLLHAREVVLCGDNVTAHAGALPDRHGVVLTVGTGVGCLAVDPTSGTIRRVDGWGYLFGDDGSAFAIGRAGLAAVLRAVDGRGPSTVLSDLARERYGPVELMPQRLYTSHRTVDEAAQFAVDVLTAAELGDNVSVAIVRAAACELARTAAAGVAALPGSSAVPVACTGRLIGTSSLLADTLRAELARVCARARPVPAAGSALDGACWLASTTDSTPYGPYLHIYRG